MPFFKFFYPISLIALVATTKHPNITFTKGLRRWNARFIHGSRISKGSFFCLWYDVFLVALTIACKCNLTTVSGVTCWNPLDKPKKADPLRRLDWYMSLKWWIKQIYHISRHLKVNESICRMWIPTMDLFNCIYCGVQAQIFNITLFKGNSSHLSMQSTRKHTGQSV